jgi:hypothetical protein
LAGVIGAYLFVLLTAGLQLDIRKRTAAHLVGVPLAIACMHLSWGAGFLWGMIFPKNINKG